MRFLESLESRPFSATLPPGVQGKGLYLGAGPMALEVAVFEATQPPAAPQLRTLHNERTGRRAAPVLIVVGWGQDKAALCGPSRDGVTIVQDADRMQVERICRAALEAPDRHGAIRFLAHALSQLEARTPGLQNSGLFALHELEAGVPRRADWNRAGDNARPLLALRSRRLVEGLGFTIQALPGPASVLVARGTKIAVAVFLERPDEIDPPDSRFDGLSPISYALAKADQENLDYVMVSAGAVLRVYPVKPGVGTGRRGRTETFLELSLDLLREGDAGYLWLLCSAHALSSGGSFAEILKNSEIFAADLGARLRERVYRDVVPGIARALVAARRLRNPSAERLRETYEMALLVLFRLLFVAYAEDKELLPFQRCSSYRSHSLKEMARRLQAAYGSGTPFEGEDFYWNEVNQLWKAVDRGNRTWSVPPYNGGLFVSDEDATPGARALAGLSIADRDFAPPLAALLLEQTEEGDPGPIDFRSLGVREFGTIYEGLLESELSIAAADLSVDPHSQAFLPAKGDQPVAVEEGKVYLHNASGARKASGAYYTKHFAVEHLLDHALEPALDDHLRRLDTIGDARDAADRFFDFRVADIAMGSGHFLVAAIDRIERRLSNYLARRPLPGVADELARLRAAAQEALGDNGDGEPIEDARLLRRQIARRCVYGVDLNPLAVELARLSVWIHTFVPGLPLSFLDHNLVIGNSLVGIATFDEASELIGAHSGELFSFTAAERLKSAREPIEKLARLADANAAEIKTAKKLYAEARRSIADEADLLTVLAASRIDDEIRGAVASGLVAARAEEQGDMFSAALARRAEKALSGLQVLHFPITFPEAFLGARGGFDVVLGNPPWEEVMCDVNEFWGRFIPGFRGKPQREQEALLPKFRKGRPDLEEVFLSNRERVERLRQVLTSGAFPGIVTGHPDLYKAFCWRFWNLVSPEGGRIGVVLPRSALAAKGSTEFRLRVFETAQRVDVTMLLNNRTWVFEEVHPQYTIGLVAITRGYTGQTPVALRGPYASEARYSEGMVREPAVFYGKDIVGWSDTASLPLLPSERSADVFAKLRRAPRLDLDDGSSWHVRPVQGDLNATWGKPSMDLKSKECPDGFWPVFKGESFDIWNPDTGTYYAWADPRTLLKELQDKRTRAARSRNSAFSEFPSEWTHNPKTLPCLSPRVAFRDVSRATDTRTVRAALIPGEVCITNKGPYFLWPRGDEKDQAFLLSVLSSIPLDWYARRFVEVSLNFFILNPFPVPRPERSHPLWLRCVDLAGQLASPDRRFAAWAHAVGVRQRGVGEDEREDMIAELDGAVAHLYDLNEQDLAHIFETFHEGWDYQARLDRTLAHFRALKSLA
jgi:hypothetical protein